MTKEILYNLLPRIKEHSFFADFKCRKGYETLLYRKEKYLNKYKKEIIYFRTINFGEQFWICSIYTVRFDVLIDWVAQFHVMSKDLQKEGSTVMRGNDILNHDSYLIYNERKDSLDLFYDYAESVVTASAIKTFTQFSTIEDVYEILIKPVLYADETIFPDNSVLWVFQYLACSKIVDPANYPLVKEKILKRVEWMRDRGEPNVLMCYERLPEIIEYLESNDITAVKSRRRS